MLLANWRIVGVACKLYIRLVEKELSFVGKLRFALPIDIASLEWYFIFKSHQAILSKF